MVFEESPQEHNPPPTSPTTPACLTNEKQLISEVFFTWAIRFFLAYFGARLIFLAVSVSPAVPPDEVTHAGVCSVFSQVFLFPDNSPATYQFGLVTNIPWLYYWLMGKLLHLNVFGLSDLVFLRLLNIPLAFGTIHFARKILLLLTRDRLTHLLVVVALTNTAMFSLLSASVSYDNLTNLLAAMAIYYLLAFFQKPSGTLLMGTFICQLVGCLTKITFLPLVLVLNLLLLAHGIWHLRDIPAALKECFRNKNSGAVGLGVLLIMAVALNLHLHAGNYLRYGTLNPSLTVVVSTDAAMNNRLDARGLIFNQYKEGKISYMDALIMAGEIKHPGDKADTFYLLMNYQKMKNAPESRLRLPEYAVVWFENMVGSIYGIKAHLIMAKDAAFLIPLYALMALSLLGFVVRWRPGASGWLPVDLAAIVCIYAVYFLYEVNYDSYLNYGALGLTLYGRYLFPVIAPFYTLLCRYLLALFTNDRLRVALAAGAALLFISYDFPWFLLHSTREWYF